MTTPSDSSSPAPAPSGPTPSKYDDHRRPLFTALRNGAYALGVVAVVSVIAWSFAEGSPGFWGALIGGGYVLLTAVSVLATSGQSIGTIGAVVLGGWLVKVVLVLLILMLLDPLTFYHRGAMVITLIVALVVCIIAEMVGVLRTRTTYVTPVSGNTGE
ncbi:hypothetical protein [Corynebacterium guangdongense]|uniref:ATP synthase protein I n=1 Tax=Corynebacterium guangdongense TaxID=1783348 RepID=A0ABU1ZXL9_9CORY|nr:hypothetical protein [Corynebacterium guangdongense]MDR7329113.1 hypothetical protein [Corynebacterium guangdongense]WJZ17682.1 hypothetical protein CGUA_05490 [Corynebacterium guangdongense]